MTNKWTLMLMTILAFNVRSENIIDIYGAESNQSNMIVTKHKKEISMIEQSFIKQMKQLILTGDSDNTSLMRLKVRKEHVCNQIKKEGGFLFVDFGTVLYDDTKKMYTTIEIIEKNRPERLKFVDSNVEIENNQNQAAPDLIDTMITYDKFVDELFLKNELDTKNQPCPVYHCTIGFSHIKLKPYLNIFNAGAIKERKLIIDTMNHDKNSQRRAAAAFLIGHFKDPNEIISILSQHVNDPAASVRNNVLRVIGETMKKANINTIDVLPFLTLLESPYETDRNKALIILLRASSSKSSRTIIIQKGKDGLINTLKLKQPNNHNISYSILTTISGEKYSENNIVAWKNWLEMYQEKQKNNFNNMEKGE